MKKITYLLLSAVLAFSFIGCNKGENTVNASKEKKVLTSEVANNEDKKEEVKDDKEVKSNEGAKDSKEKIKANLYFSDDQVQYLNKEEVKLDDLNAQVLIEKLKEGPKVKTNYAVIPKDLNIKVKVKDKEAYVDLPKDVSEKFQQGSTNEGMFVYSIVNTLTLNKDLGIEKVKFLIDGKDAEVISGMDISQPLKANNSLIKQ